jgi:hypothetical protein
MAMIAGYHGHRTDLATLRTLSDLAEKASLTQMIQSQTPTPASGRSGSRWNICRN